MGRGFGAVEGFVLGGRLGLAEGHHIVLVESKLGQAAICLACAVGLQAQAGLRVGHLFLLIDQDRGFVDRAPELPGTGNVFQAGTVDQQLALSLYLTH